jgi:C4-dicarboxylate transporter DctQ subunit
MKIDKWIKFLEDTVCTVSLAIIVVLVIVQVFYRYVLSSGILWIDELVTNLMVLMVLFGAAAATRNNVHTDLQVFVKKSPIKVSLVLEIIGTTITLLFLLILIYISVIYTYKSRGLSTIMIQLPLWLVYGIMPVGGILIFYEFIKKLKRKFFVQKTANEA